MKHWTSIIREVFPCAVILDAALQFPITKQGWLIDIPNDIVFSYDTKLFINLQDMLTAEPGQEFPRELVRLESQLQELDYPLDQCYVLTWPLGIKAVWPRDSFRIIEFSSHQYETWCAYKRAETVLREAFDSSCKQFVFNYVCPQRIYKPHRAALHTSLDHSWGNVSLQSKGIELAYPSLTVEEYDARYDNLTNLLAMKQNYNTACFTVVSESQYSERFGIITEKTLNAIVAGTPILLCAHQNALDHVAQLGFRTYNYLFDELYDELDNIVRMKDMCMSNYRYILEPMSEAEMQDIHDKFQGVIDYNRNWFFDHFGSVLQDNLRTDLLAAWQGY